jgi:two-component system response regulator HydG
MEGHVLIVDDDRDMSDTIAAALRSRGFQVECRSSAVEALQALEQDDYDVVVTDLVMPAMSGVEFCERMVSNRPDTLVVLLTAFGSLDTAVAAIRAGAYDFLTKPFDFEQLAMVLRRAVKHRRMERELTRLRRAVTTAPEDEELLGESAAMTNLRSLLARIGDSTASVLITGESGTGKELVARSLHRRSGRTGPFVAINCAAVPENLLESELFGHTRGAFTDAQRAREGLFRQAHGGTLFLDEIGDMPMALQAKLLRALQERVVRPVGGEKEFAFDSRIIAATNRDLESRVDEGLFREDLFFRLNVIHVAIPPLRSRGQDVLLLAHRFLRTFAERMDKRIQGISRPAAEKLLSYYWPGNVRELENCIEHAATLAQFDQIIVEDLPEKLRNYHVSHVITASDDPADLVPMEEIERRYIRRVLEVVGGNKSQAAKILGLDRRTLYRRLERYGEPPGAF